MAKNTLTAFLVFLGYNWPFLPLVDGLNSTDTLRIAHQGFLCPSLLSTHLVALRTLQCFPGESEGAERGRTRQSDIIPACKADPLLNAIKRTRPPKLHLYLTLVDKVRRAVVAGNYLSVSLRIHQQERECSRWCLIYRGEGTCGRERVNKKNPRFRRIILGNRKINICFFSSSVLCDLPEMPIESWRGIEVGGSLCIGSIDCAITLSWPRKKLFGPF